jgi:dienelactone hydrolase
MANWYIEKLYSEKTSYEVISNEGPISGIVYQNEPFLGKPSKVFAYLGIPENIKGKVPAVVCIHGGGGKAFKEWVDLWVKRGYAAISMDFGGMGPDGKRLPDGGPEQTHEAKFTVGLGWKNLWTYHAIAAIIRANNILRLDSRIDSGRIAATGISWGGYLTCIISEVDNRLSCAIPVYGCGFLQDNSAADWMNIFSKMSAEDKKFWHDKCDPSVYLENTRIPVMFVTGTNDFAYPLDSLKKSYSIVKGPLTLCVRPEMPHGHEAGWAPREIQAYTDSLFRMAPSLPKISAMTVDGTLVSARFSSDRKIAGAYFLYTKDKGQWQARKWVKVPAKLKKGCISAEMSSDVTACYLALETDDGLWVSTPHEEING